jgi:pimeloyl-ACP methyl ester carboxylesterase/DNA-binding winged helix-turn-helix (wHTH) protein
MLFRFDGYSLDVARRELRRGDSLIAVEPQVFDLLVHFVRHRDRVISKDELIDAIWHGRIVSESTVTSRINAARKALGDSGEEQRLIRTAARKGFRFIGDVTETFEDASAASDQDLPPAPLRQEVRFCTSPDGVRIAHAAVGRGPPLVRSGHWLTHLEYDWESPIWSVFIDELAAGHRLIRYDARGNGLSDWDVAEISFDALVRDLETVVEANGLDRFALLGLSQGAAVSIAYAVRHPERVSHLVLLGGFAQGPRARGIPEQVAACDAMLTLIRQGWGQENPAFRQLFTSLFIPGGTPEQVQWYNDLQRRSASPENACRMRAAIDLIDVSDLLEQVRAPTLVLHCREDARVPFEEGRRLAAGIPGARFVALESRNHVLIEGEPAWDRFFAEFRDFVRS